jgi:hypothetical protein
MKTLNQRDYLKDENVQRFSHGVELVSPPDQVDPLLDALNMLSRAAYRQRLNETQNVLTKIMVVDLYSLTFIDHNFQETVSIAPPLYTLLKDWGHSCLGTYSVVIPFLKKEFSGKRAELISFKEHLQESYMRFKQLDWSLEVQLLVEKIFLLNEKLLQIAIESESFEEKFLTDWGSSLKPLLDQSFRDAARVQIDAIHNAVTQWGASLGSEPWKNLWVIPMGPRIAREGFLQTQYFERLIGPEGARDRIIFGENLSQITEALRLLQSVVLDRSLSLTLFGDPLRMEIDILAYGAREYLDDLFGFSSNAWNFEINNNLIR